MNRVIVNSKLFSEEDAKISALDRGFRFGESVFETMRVSNGKIFQFDFHRSRMEQGLKALNIQYNTFESDCLKVLGDLESGFIRCQVSSGVGSVGYSSTAKEATVVFNVMQPKKSDFQAVKLNVSKYTVVPRSCFPKGFKSGQSLNYSLAIEDAKSKGFYDSLMLTVNGEIAETCSSNFFWIKERKLYTPSIETDCVIGSVRALIMDNFEVFEAKSTLEDLKGADAAFITNIGHMVKPIRSIKNIAEYKTEESKIYRGVKELIRRSFGLS